MEDNVDTHNNRRVNKLIDAPLFHVFGPPLLTCKDVCGWVKEAISQSKSGKREECCFVRLKPCVCSWSTSASDRWPNYCCYDVFWHRAKLGHDTIILYSEGNIFCIICSAQQCFFFPLLDLDFAMGGGLFFMCEHTFLKQWCHVSADLNGTLYLCVITVLKYRV